ncbi:MAG: Fe-S cluster protein [Proteobacteria bacterium]|nr:Fe-S cluster protein [Pseudomonadota bacterium]
MLLNKYKILRILPCLADPDKIRAIFELGEDIGEVMPYLNASIKDGIYNHEFKTLTLVKDGLMITLYPCKVTIAKADDESHADRVIAELKGLINKTYENREGMVPDFGRKKELKAQDIYQILPQTNCKKCRVFNCFAFAVSLLNGKREIAECTPLFQPENRERRELLLNILRDTGSRDTLGDTERNGR